MMTAEEYIQSLRDLRPRRVYAFGEKIEDCVSHPLIRPSINCCAMTYKLAEMPEYRELMVTSSSFTGKPVNRFCHLHQSTADLVNKVKMQRLCGSMTGACFQRCVGMDALNSHQILVMPTQTMREEDRDYAVAFSVPADDPGILYIYGRQASDTRKLEASKVDVGNANYGGQEVIIIFEDTFVPYKNVYMLGEIDFTGMLVERFAGYNRQSYGGCKVGNGDVLIGASQTAAECNGCAKASHIKDKIIEMIHLNETLFSCGIACSCEGSPTRAGNYQIDMLLANVCKQNVTRLPYEIARLAQDIAGGLMVTMPSDADFTSDEVGEWCRKLMVGDARYSVEDRQRILRLIEAMTIGSVAVGYLTESMHGAGSPQAQRIMIGRQANMEAKKALARRLCGIDPDGLF